LKTLTIGLATAVLAGVVILTLVLRRSHEGSSNDDSGRSGDQLESVRARLANRARSHSVPHFEPIEPPQSAPQAPPPPVPALTPPPLEVPPPTPAGELRARASKDGFLFREAGSQQIYLVQKGTKFLIHDETELRSMGYTADHVETVPPGSLNFLLDRPPEKTLFRERDSPAVYYYENGQKRVIANEKVFEGLGHKWSDVKVVPKGALQNESNGAPIQ
jgi:hypothetical protein